MVISWRRRLRPITTCDIFRSFSSPRVGAESTVKKPRNSVFRNISRNRSSNRSSSILLSGWPKMAIATSLDGRFARPDLYLARQRPCFHSKQVEDDLSNIRRLKLPRFFIRNRIPAERSIYAARANVADLDIVLPDLLHQSLGKPVERKFRCVVGGHSRMQVLTRQRRNIYDVAATPFLEIRNCVMARVKRTEKVGFERLPEFGRARFFDSLAEKSYPCVVDKDVDD